MPRGKYTNHKGRSRRFTSAEELEEQRRQEERNRQRKLERGSDTSSEEEEQAAEDRSDEGSSEESDSDDGPQKAKGVENLIEVQNPNRAPQRNKKVTAINDAEAKPELSRREREEIEKQRATAHYNMLHAKGKTAQARADLARLAIVKQQREEAAKRREAEKLEKEAAKQSKTAQTLKAIGKKSE
ncbi:28 kDa heat- and acid-stable phosphoprotein-like [Rhodnius prolixus]|uniref:Putative casein kinase substrate phosphoprotein pp28 n=2 Tax=Rhodnius TaxID=13248 RepID=R4G8L5_RHOPR